ncbi:MAG TPA: EamA family transporter [Candidatus Nanoarchaeia archaeon]|nr:EamA family transporter [Candidatus Nanoarchaeia archaeon]
MTEKSSLRSGFLLMIACTIFTSSGQMFWKAGALRINFSNPFTFFNVPFIVGCLLYIVGSVLMILALKKGELSMLYPIIATSYVWVSILAPFFFPTEVMNVWKWAGVLLILCSICLLGWSSSRVSEVQGNSL